MTRPLPLSVLSNRTCLSPFHLLSLLLGLLMSAGASASADGPEYSGHYTRARIANLLANVGRFNWVRERRDAAVRRAERWVRLSDEDLWSLIPSQDLPRTIDPQMQDGVRTGGCPACGADAFHVRNGREHLMSYHALPGPVEAQGLRLTPQPKGSYAGADVSHGTSIKGPRMGYSWLKHVERDGGLCRVDCGDVCFVRTFKDVKDYGKGYVYNFEEGAAFVIPNRLHVDRRRGSPR